jgi:serine/threonine protein kinase
MTLAQIERVFGRGRLKMATGEHVEVFREAVAPGERRRYTKRFLTTSDGDFGQWTEREWRILARLIGHGIRCVPGVVQFDGGAMGGIRLVQTYDAGLTVDQWATLLPVARDGATRRHVFEDCAHWWALAHYCVAALDEIHSLQLVHLDIKGDNICIPYGPANFDPESSALLHPIFTRLALIDFAFSLVSRDNLSSPLPIGWQKDYDYQSPRLLKALGAGHKGDLQPTKDLDWRCDLYSLAAMLKRYLPIDAADDDTGWTPKRYDDARTLIFRLRECHDRDLPHWRPHQQLMDFTGARMAENDLAASLNYGWALARDASTDATAPITPMTRIVPSIWVAEPVRITTPIVVPTAVTAVRRIAPAPAPRRSVWRASALASAIVALVALAAPPFIGDPEHTLADSAREALGSLRSMYEAASARVAATVEPAAPPLERNASAPPPPAAETPERPEEPGAVAAPAPDMARGEPDPKPSSPRTGRSALPAPVANARSASGTQQAPTQPMPSSSPSASAMARSAHPNSRSASTTNQKQSRGSSVAYGPSGHSSQRPSSLPQQRFHASTPAVQTAPASADPIAPIASAATEPSSAAPSNQPPRRPSSPSSVPASQSSPAEPSRTAIEDRATPTTEAIASPESVEHRRPSATATTEGQKTPQNPKRSSDWRPLLADLGKLLRGRGREEPPAPVEERNLAIAPQAATPRALARSSQDPPGRALPRPTEPASPPSIPAQSWAEVSPSALAAPLATAPTLSADARARAMSPAISAPAARASPPLAESVERPWDRSQDDIVAARRMVVDMVPSIAAQAQPDVSRVLRLAAAATHRSQQQAIVDAAQANWPGETAWTYATYTEPARARRLHDDARQAFASGRVSDALNIELRAFGANPHDPDIASYLALLHIRTHPAQPETARQLALYAISVSGSQRSARFGDWDTLAVASALTGRDVEATHAFLVEVALTSDLDRTCQTALGAYKNFGERLRRPVRAMLDRLDSNGRVSPHCEWPVAWRAATR